MRSKIILLFSLFVFVQLYAQTKNKFTTDKDIFGTRVFIENKGQFNKSIPTDEKVYYAFENGLEKIYFTATGLVYKLCENKVLTHEEKEEMEHGKKMEEPKFYYVNMNWQNANPHIEIEQSQKQDRYFTYGTAELNAYVYKKITYKNVYNNIDIEYTIPEDKTNGIKYNVIIHPGANPSDIKIVYTGDVKNITINKGGDIVIKTPLEPIIEHAPKSFYQNKENIASHFSLEKNTISFNFQHGYDNKQTIIIDPWVTTLTSLSTNNYGYDVDYDFAGNLFVYGGGITNGVFCKVAKYSFSGVLLWTFSGQIIAPLWNSTIYPGGFVVHKTSGKVYVGESFYFAGARIIRLDISGNYDNLISTASPSWNEIWDMAYHCSTGNVFGIGGSSVGLNQAGILNTVSGTMVPVDFFPGFGGTTHDLANHAIDDAGNVYIMHSCFSTLNNQIGKINSAFTSSVWIAPSTYNTFNELSNKANYIGGSIPGGWTNGFNCLAVNGNYLYYYDGLNLAAYNKLTGAKVGFTTVPLTVMQQGGIAVDDCDNVYIGGNGSILAYNFNGTTFNVLASIPLGVSTTNKYVYDIKLDKPTNILYVCGSGFAGTYSAIHSLVCTVNQYSLTTNCVGNNNGSAVATVSTNIGSPLFTYIWSNTSGTVSSTSNSALSTNTVNNLTNGNYTLSIQINAPCGPLYTTTLNIDCQCSATVAATTACPLGGNTTYLSVSAVNGFTPAPTFTWTGPASYSSTLQNPPVFVSNNVYGTYTLTASNGNCTYTTIINTAPLSSFTPAINANSVSCNGFNNGTATCSIIGGLLPFTYTWTTVPVQNTAMANNLAPGTYTINVQDVSGCAYSATTQITQPPALSLSIVPSATLACVNTSVNLTGTASGGMGSVYNYSWAGGPNTANNSVTQTLPGNYVYTLTASDANACSITQTISLTFDAYPVLGFPVGSFTNITCINPSGAATVSVSPIGTYSYSWSNGQSAVTATNLTAGLYSVSVTNTSGCVSTQTVLITQNTIAPNISAGLPSTLTCLNPSVVLNGSSTSSGVTYTWLPQNVSTNSVLVSSAGNYTFSVFDPINGCSSTSVVVVSQNISLPNIAATGSGSLNCLTTSVVLTGTSTTSGVIYNWQPQNVNTNTALVTTGGNYTLTVTNPINSCVSSTVLTVLQNTLLPTGNVMIPSELNCLLTSATLSANSTGNNSVWNGPGLVNAPNPSVINIPGTYSVTVTNTLNACVSNSVVVVTQNTIAPGVLASVSNTISCNVPSAILTASSSATGVVYQWTTGPSTAINTVTLAGTYTVTVTDPLNGCASSTQVVVFAAPVLSANVNVLSQINCFGNNNGVLQVNVLGGVGSFSVTNINNGNGIGPTSSFPLNFSGLGAASYSILVLDNATGCNQTLFATITQPAALNLALGGNAALCEGQSTTISSNASGGSAPYAYVWSPNGGNGANLTISPNANTTFSVLLTDNNGCVAQASIAIVVNPKPNASLVNDKLVGCSPVCAGFSLSAIQQPGYVYTWQFTNNQSASVTSSQLYQPDLCFKEEGSYNAGIVISSAAGCSTTLTYNNLIQVYLKPNADFSFSPERPTSLEPTVQLTNLSSGASAYAWFNSNVISPFSTQSNPSYVFPDAGEYLIVLIASNGSCSDTTLKTITVEDEFLFYAPNAFTPNGDQINDTWLPVISGYKEGSFNLSIFDRWGEQIMQSDNLKAQGWDGSFKKIPCKQDVYIWKVNVKDNKGKLHQFMGHVTLLN